LTIQDGDILHVSVSRASSPIVGDEIKKMGEPE
jgi:hypothetical protein